MNTLKSEHMNAALIILKLLHALQPTVLLQKELTQGRFGVVKIALQLSNSPIRVCIIA